MMYRFDPRSKLWGVLMIVLATTFTSSYFIEISTTLIFIICLIISGQKKTALRLAVIYLVQWLVYLFILPKINQPFLMFSLSFLVNGMRELMPAIASLNFIFKTTRMPEWIALFKLWKFPTFIIIPLMVIGRFFPTIHQDYQHITRAMRFRGIAVSPRQWLLNPAQMFEYILVPLLMNATLVGEDLTISALTKGFSIHGPKTSLTQLKMHVYDYLFMVIITLPNALYYGGILS